MGNVEHRGNGLRMGIVDNVHTIRFSLGWSCFRFWPLAIGMFPYDSFGSSNRFAHVSRM